MASIEKLVFLIVALTVTCFVKAKFQSTLVVTANEDESHSSYEEESYNPYKEKCDVKTSFENVEESLRSFIFLADVEKAAKILKSNRTFSLAAGFTYGPEEQCAVVVSEDRENDPDVVAFRAAALHVYKYGNPARVAKIMAESFVSDCQTCSVFTGADELDDITDSFTAFLSDKKNIEDVLLGDPREDGRRKLLSTESSPTNSLICAYCYPKKGCTAPSWCQ